jgi:CRP-like cAMP-binding protein
MLLDAPLAISLFEAEPDLLECVPEEDRDMALRVGRLRGTHIEPGAWTPEPVDGEPAFAHVITEGALVGTLHIGDRESARIIGPGDLFDPIRPAGRLLSIEQSWRALQPTTILALDGRFLAMARRWPHLTVAIQQRLCDEATSAAVLAAIGHLPRVEQRVLGLLWHLADRFGRVGQDGMIIDLPLTHAELGRLVGARRPTVTLALQDLRSAGQLERRDEGSWWLAEGSRAKLAV